MDRKPFELRILGSTELFGSAGTGNGVVRQPKRLALLAYLALGTAAGFRRRDEVIGLFWPELEQAQGRTYLRKALHALRLDLGENVILVRGDDEIRLDQSMIWCDAVALREHQRAGRYREALDLYRGDLLSGLFPEGVAQEFEEWLRHERKALRHAAAASAWECVRIEEENGPTTAAAATARRALEIDPDNEEGVRRLMLLLDRRGDRGGALRVYAEWQEYLHDEYGVEPAPETRKLARNVQAARKGESHETLPTLVQVDQRSSVSDDFAPTARSDQSESGSAKQKILFAPSRRITLTFGFCAVAAFGALAMRFVTSTGSEYARSVRVSPFRTIGDSRLQNPADALMEEITTALAMDSTLFVRAATERSDLSSAEALFTGRRTRSAYVLYGAVQRSSAKIRVTLRLVRTSDGTAVWASSNDLDDDADGTDRVRGLARNAASTISRQIARQ